MKLKSFIWIVEFLAIVAWAALFMSLFFVNPFKTEAIIFVSFFASLFFALAFSWGLVEFYLVTKIKGVDEMRGRSFAAFRHGAMVSMVVTGMLLMQGAEVLTPWDGVVFLLAIVLFEAYFLTRGGMVVEEKQ